MIDKFLDDAGYLRIYSPAHPHNNNGYMLDHRLIMEGHIKQYLNVDWVVHHINHNKVDNRIKNLFLCSQAEHVAIHNREKGHSTINKHNLRKAVQKK